MPCFECQMKNSFTVPLWFWFSRVIQTHFGLRVRLIIAVDVSKFTKKNSLNNQEIYINVNVNVVFYPRSHMEVCYE